MQKSSDKHQIDFKIDENVGPRKEFAQSQSQTKKQFTPEGVILTETQQKYLLPHFTMLVVGKPGSGKTSTIRTMLTSEDYYLHKFDYIIVVSPSASKMGIPINTKNMNQKFDLKWIESRLLEFNKQQIQNIVARLRELSIIEKFNVDKLNGELYDTIRTDMHNPNNPVVYTQKQIPNLFADKERFFTKQIQNNIQPTQKTRQKKAGAKPNEQPQVDIAEFVDRAYKEYYVKLPSEERPKFLKNCLIIFDDMVSQIKANEFNPLLTQLIFNRRHLLLGGTVSVMIVAQKYTMIPARLRSNANWLILFRLNPVDLDNVYKDVVMLYRDQWDKLIDFSFGGLEKKFNNLGIWVESDDYFLNFKKIDITQQ